MRGWLKKKPLPKKAKDEARCKHVACKSFSVCVLCPGHPQESLVALGAYDSELFSYTLLEAANAKEDTKEVSRIYGSFVPQLSSHTLVV